MHGGSSRRDEHGRGDEWPRGLAALGETQQGRMRGNGNNLVLAGDLVGRAIRCMLNAKCELPEFRKVKRTEAR